MHLALMTGLKLLHPIMPFITEELYHRLPPLDGEERKTSIMLEEFPTQTEVIEVVR